VGLYVPGGKAAYPSSVLMNAIPAKVAGVSEVIMVTPTPGGQRNPIVLAAAAIAGVDRAFAVGGAQAVGALAYGTQTVPGVDKIVGPGNAYVAAAKRRVFGTVGIDMIAGPSEILIICDGKTPADWIAMDLFSQAEHDELAQAILLCPDAAYLDAVSDAISRLLPTMPRADIIRTSLANRGALILVQSIEQACEISNRIAPEHLEVSTESAEQWLPNYGMPARFSWGATARSRSVTTARDPTMSCRHPALPGFPRHLGSMTFRNAPASSRSRPLARRRLAKSPRRWRMARVSKPMLPVRNTDWPNSDHTLNLIQPLQ